MDGKIDSRQRRGREEMRKRRERERKILIER
jgi:hypothetical protein